MGEITLKPENPLRFRCAMINFPLLTLTPEKGDQHRLLNSIQSFHKLIQKILNFPILNQRYHLLLLQTRENRALSIHWSIDPLALWLVMNKLVNR